MRGREEEERGRIEEVEGGKRRREGRIEEPAK